ncbi:MAG: hypothetical protein ACE37L_09330 [Allomuricauda sp.]
MKKSIILTLTMLLFQLGFSQENWDKIDLGNWGEIKMPSSLEVQSGNYKKIIDYQKRHFSVNAERIVFQQKGVNNGKNLDTYGRIIIRTDFASEEFPDLNTTEITSQDIADLNQMYKSQIYEVVNNPTYPAKIIKWNGVKIVTLNGNKSINYSYVRQMNGKPQTYSEFYIFWKGNRQHTLNIEYRIIDSDKWKSDLEKATKTFKLK